MEVSVGCCVLGVATIIIFVVWSVSNWLWFEPTKKKKHLRDGGRHISSYTGMFGDIKEMVQTTTEAKSKQIRLSHDMAPRISPFFYRSINTHEFQVGDKVMLKVSSWKGIVRFKKDGTFSPGFLGPFTVLERVGSQAYKLDLPPDMHDIHDTFHVGYLYECLAEQQNVIPSSDVHIHDERKYIGEPQAILDTKIKRLQNKKILQKEIPLSDVQNDETRYIDEPEAILDTKVMSLRNKEILLVKVRWRHGRGVNITWESKEEIQKIYPHMFV